MIVCFDDYELDPKRLELRRAGAVLRADAVVVRMLAALACDAGQLVTTDELLARVWDGRAVSQTVITVTIARLRRMLGHKAGAQEFVINVRGRGYRFVRPVSKIDRALAPLLNSGELVCAPTESSDFVGRESVMSRLRAALREAEGGRGGVCLLSGEPGIGKTRAVEQLAHEARDANLLVAWGHCFEAGDTPPLSPLRQLTRELSRNHGQRQAKSSEREAGAMLERDEFFSEAPVAKHRLFDGVLEVFSRISADTPCLLIIDDLHRADAASLELMRQWVDAIAHTRVLLVCTMRTAEGRNAGASPDLAYVRGHRNCTRIALDRLSEQAVAAYVQATLDDPQGRFARAVYRKSEGNPFFMVELARQLVLTGAQSADALAVPDAALDLLRPRLLQLDLEAYGALSCAAVIGATFELATLASVLQRPLSELMPLLDEALANDVIKSAPDAKTAFAFGHELIRRVLYESLPSSGRRRLHLDVAKVLGEQQQTGKQVPAAIIAHHLHAALPDGDAGKTLAACTDAADEAVRLFAFADSVGHLRHALEAIDLKADATPAARMGLLLRQAADARVAVAPEFEGAVAAVIQIARQHRSGMFMVMAGGLLNFHPGFPPLRGGRAALEEALPLLKPHEDALRAVALAHLATCSPLAYDEEASSAQLAQARALVERSKSPHAWFGLLTAQLYLTGGRVHDAEGAVSEGEVAYERFVQQGGSPFVFVMLDLHRAIIALQCGDAGRAQQALERARGRCEALGSRELLWHVERFQTRAKLAHGDPFAAEDLRALHRRAREHAIVATDLLIVYDEALALGDELPFAKVSDVCAEDPADTPGIWAMKVRLLAAMGLRDDAERALRKVRPERLRDLPRDRDHLGTLGALARAAIDLRASDYLEALAPLLARHADKRGVHVALHDEGTLGALCAEVAALLAEERASSQRVPVQRARAE